MFTVQCLRLICWGSRSNYATLIPFRVQRSGFRVQGSGCSDQGLGFRVQGSGSRVQGSEFRVQGLRFGGMCTLTLLEHAFGM